MRTSSTCVRGLTALAVLLLLVLVLASSGEAARSKYEEIEVTDGGTISGRVTWSGERPTPDALPINKNPEVCDLHQTGTRESVRLEVSKSGGVKNAVVYLEDVTRGKPMETGELVIDQIGCAYVPHVTIAPRKSKVTLKSSDEVLHNIHMFGAANYNIPFPDKNSVIKTFRKSGVVRLQCDAGHGWMGAYIHVANHPYYALTDAEGNFELTDVPPGEYTIKMWHESWVVTSTTTKEGEVTGYEYAEPIELSDTVTVGAGSDSQVDFTLSKQ